MKERAQQLARLRAMREGTERLREVQFAQAQHAVALVDGKVLAIDAARQERHAESHSMLLAGELQGWRMAQASDALAQAAREQMERLRAERLYIAHEKQHAWIASRVKTEQALTLERNVKEQIRAEGDRRAQAESDERFVSRTHWQAALAARLMNEN